MAQLQAQLEAAGRGVRLEYVLAVPAARYGEFRAELQSLEATHDAAVAWEGEMLWATGDEKDPADPPRQYRLVVAHDPVVAQRRSQARREQMRELIALGQQWGGRLDAQDAGERREGEVDGHRFTSSCARLIWASRPLPRLRRMSRTSPMTTR